MLLVEILNHWVHIDSYGCLVLEGKALLGFLLVTLEIARVFNCFKPLLCDLILDSCLYFCCKEYFWTCLSACFVLFTCATLGSNTKVTVGVCVHARACLCV